MPTFELPLHASQYLSHMQEDKFGTGKQADNQRTLARLFHDRG